MKQLTSIVLLSAAALTVGCHTTTPSDTYRLNSTPSLSDNTTTNLDATFVDGKPVWARLNYANKKESMEIRADELGVNYACHGTDTPPKGLIIQGKRVEEGIRTQVKTPRGFGVSICQTDLRSDYRRKNDPYPSGALILKKGSIRLEEALSKSNNAFDEAIEKAAAYSD